MLYTKAFAVLEQERQELLAIPDKKASQIDRINELDRMIWEYFYRIEGLREAWGIMEASRGNIDINSVIEVILSFGRDDHNSSGHFF
ncbi:MAG: hypothetical protein HYV39_03370 [Candidatus Levybacteria bacterium]|nr:hypothetical protein [Candidatus Levybacteria bacterium]